MNIVVLDGYTLNPGDLNWDALEALGDCTVYDRTAADEIIARASGAEIVLTNKTSLSGETLNQLDGLKYVGVLATGFNVVDTATASERGVVVCNVPAYGTPSVAQAVFAHILNLTQWVGHHAEAVTGGRWTACPDFTFWDVPLVELSGKTLGIIGQGDIGRETAKIAEAFGMQVMSTNSKSSEADLQALLKQSDVVSIHCPLTPATDGLINADRLALMKPTAFLINTSRGPVVVEQDLADALNDGGIAGAGLDVLSTEPPPADNPRLNAKNCCVTPHLA